MRAAVTVACDGRSSAVRAASGLGVREFGVPIRKGSDARLRAEGLEAFRGRVAALAPEFADRVGAVRSWDDVSLLRVRLDRMPRWFSPGLLCIGDAAHAMSPVGGVGINLAIQDAVAAARYLAAPLRRGEVRLGDLARVQVRRWAPTFVTQALQQLAHRLVLEPVLVGALRESDVRGPSRLARLLRRFPRLQAIPAYIVAIGVLPEHAPPFARRS